ncbi:MAG: NUDIX hydrolase [Steroidobacteraceae bacterium]
MATPSTPATPRPAATIMLLREGAQGLEVLMVVRHHQIDFASGALVFPGGKLAKGDQDARVPGRCTGIDGLTPEQIALRVGAIREAFEESGILLARSRAASAPLDANRVTELGTRYRKGLDAGDIGMADMLETEDLVLTCDALVPFAHWITPDILPKRFDTHFSLAAAPADQRAVHDGKEMVDSEWVRPNDALAQAAAGARTLVPATRLNLQKLARNMNLAGALQAARTQRIVTVSPKTIVRPTGRVLEIPAEADYGITEFAIPEDELR